MIGRDWTHLGVAKLYTDICRNGYKIMYLTSRAIGQADSTRDYLRGIKQNDYQLPSSSGRTGLQAYYDENGVPHILGSGIGCSWVVGTLLNNSTHQQ